MLKCLQGKETKGMNVGSIRLSKCSFWFYLLGEKVVQQSVTVA